MKLLTTLISLIFMTTASAGILVEPQVGYILSSKYTGTIGLSGPATGTIAANLDSKGPEFGARLGYQAMGLMGGLNFGKANGSSNKVGSSSGTLKTTNLGAFVGFNAPILLRAWFAYNFSAKTTVLSDEFKGNSKELGLGFTGVPFLSFNLIYRMYDYNKITISGVTVISYFLAIN